MDGSDLSGSDSEMSDFETISQVDSLIERAGIKISSCKSSCAKKIPGNSSRVTSTKNKQSIQDPDGRFSTDFVINYKKGTEGNRKNRPHPRDDMSLHTPEQNTASRETSGMPSSSAHEPSMKDILHLLRQQGSAIEKMTGKLKELKKGQAELLEAIRSEGPSAKKRKLDVPNYVRMRLKVLLGLNGLKTLSDRFTNGQIAVRDGFKSGAEAELRWTFSNAESERKLKYNSSCNEDLSSHIETFVRGLYDHVDNGIIRAAIERYYISMKETEQRRRSGKAETHKKKMASTERKRRKMVRREQALRKKTSYTEEEKKKVEKVLTIDFMSSEEEVESDGEEYFIIKRLKWRSQEADEYLFDLDSKAKQLETTRGKRQRVKRVRGVEDSERPPPPFLSQLQQWAFQSENN